MGVGRGCPWVRRVCAVCAPCGCIPGGAAGRLEVLKKRILISGTSVCFIEVGWSALRSPLAASGAALGYGPVGLGLFWGAQRLPVWEPLGVDCFLIFQDTGIHTCTGKLLKQVVASGFYNI